MITNAGFKVVNYHRWESLPDIFSSLKEAKDAKKDWAWGSGAVIEQFNYKSKSVRMRRGEK